MAGKDFSNPRAAGRTRALVEEQVRFGAPPATEPSAAAPEKAAAVREAEHRMTAVFDDGLYWRVKRYLASPGAPHRTYSDMVRELVERELAVKGF